MTRRAKTYRITPGGIDTLRDMLRTDPEFLDIARTMLDTHGPNGSLLAHLVAELDEEPRT